MFSAIHESDNKSDNFTFQDIDLENTHNKKKIFNKLSLNLEYIYSAGKDIGRYINDYKIIVTKSTIPVRTTTKLRKIIESEINNRKEKIVFDIANNPEFLKEGKAINDFNSPDRIIVG